MNKTTIYLDCTAAATDFWGHQMRKSITDYPMNVTDIRPDVGFPQEVDIETRTEVSAVGIKLTY